VEEDDGDAPRVVAAAPPSRAELYVLAERVALRVMTSACRMVSRPGTSAASEEGLLFAATASVPWATLLTRTFEIDVKTCTGCAGSLEVRAVVKDHDIARRILDDIPTAARAPPSPDATIAYEPALA
jgi:hypothetical protein